MRQRGTTRLAALAASETVFLVGAVCLATYIRFGPEMWHEMVHDYGIERTLLLAGVVQVCLYYNEMYDLRLVSDRPELFTRMLQALGVATLILAAVYFWIPVAMFGRGVFTIAVLLILVVVCGWRLAFEWMGRRLNPRERILIVGTNAAARALARELHERRHELGVAIVGFVDPDPAMVGQPIINPGVIGVVDEIPAIVRQRQVDRVVVSLADARGKLPMDRLLEMKLDAGVTFSHLATLYEDYTGKIAVENLRPSWMIFSEGFRKSRALEAAKRFIDVALAAAGVVLAAPVMLIVAAAVKLTSSGPALYHQERVGRAGRPFTVHKFRSMRVDAEAATGPVWASAGDPRTTPIGTMLRRTRLDELPQLWNVLIGEMSFVGPRPERPSFVAELTKTIPFYGLRHTVRPGLTGWAQVRYTYGATREDALEKLQYDLYYLKHFTIALDLFIVFSTIKTVLQRRGGR